jgi:hypothetical protein
VGVKVAREGIFERSGENRRRGMSEARLRAGESSRTRGKDKSLCPYQASVQERSRLFGTHKRHAIREDKPRISVGCQTAPKHQTLNRLGNWTTSRVDVEGESSDAHPDDSPSSRGARVKAALFWVSVVSSGRFYFSFPPRQSPASSYGGVE